MSGQSRRQEISSAADERTGGEDGRHSRVKRQICNSQCLKHIPCHGSESKFWPIAYNKRLILRQRLIDPFVSLTRDTG
jgi:hypothetical protein